MTPPQLYEKTKLSNQFSLSHFYKFMGGIGFFKFSDDNIGNFKISDTYYHTRNIEFF